MTTRIALDPRSLASFQVAMAQLPRRVGLRHLRIAMNAWGGVVKQEAVARVPTETKALKRSLGVRVVIPDASWNVAHHGRPSRAIVGPRRRFAAPALRTKAGQLKSIGLKRATKIVLRGGKVISRVPSRYAHLAEKHQPYIAPAQRAGNTRGLAKLAQKLGQGIHQEAQKLAARQAARRP